MLCALLFGPAAAEAQDVQPVVVELFTSQGCSTCPPADAFFAELAGRPDLVALAFHVHYWDFIGWRDPFANPQFTERQRGYVEALGSRYPYTPQIVIGGRYHEVGSDRESVEAAIRQARTETGRNPPVVLRQQDDGTLQVEIGTGEAAEGHDVLLVSYDALRETMIERGENKGRRLINAHVVRDLLRIGSWQGDPVSLTVPIPKPEKGGCAVLVQRPGHGPIVAAGSIDLE